MVFRRVLFDGCFAWCYYVGIRGASREVLLDGCFLGVIREVPFEKCFEVPLDRSTLID